MDKPLHKQYFIYMGNLARGDFGPSYKYDDRPVTDIIKETLPVSMGLGLVSLVLAFFMGTAGRNDFLTVSKKHPRHCLRADLHVTGIGPELRRWGDTHIFFLR